MMDITFETNSIWIQRFLLAFCASLLLSLIFTPISIAVLKKLNIMDIPNERKIHKQPVPRMGGFAIYAAFVIPMLFLMYFDYPQEGVIIGGGIALLIGAVDDIWGVPAIVKLIVLFALTLLIWRYGVITSLPFKQYLGLNDQIMNLAVTMLWLTGVTSAFNALDHMDGLAGGVAVIAAIAYLAVSVQTEQMFWGLVSICLVGSLLGFLCYNSHPAKVFMGDSGSFFLGFCLAAVGIMGGWSRSPIKSAVVPIAVLSLPIFDLVFVIIARILNGTTKSLRESITYCGKDHLGHRFVKIGLSHPNAVRMAYLVSATVAISALMIRHANYWQSFLLLIQIALIYIILIILTHLARGDKGL